MYKIKEHFTLLIVFLERGWKPDIRCRKKFSFYDDAWQSRFGYWILSLCHFAMSLPFSTFYFHRYSPFVNIESLERLQELLFICSPWFKKHFTNVCFIVYTPRLAYFSGEMPLCFTCLFLCCPLHRSFYLALST